MNIVKEIFERLLRKVAENPDFVYEPLYSGAVCSYIKGRNCNGCIFGQILQDIGYSTEDLRKIEFKCISNALHILGISKALTNAMSTETSDNSYLRFFDKFQSKQDSGVPWLKCLESSIIELYLK